jgi:hypothetical protein
MQKQAFPFKEGREKLPERGRVLLEGVQRNMKVHPEPPTSLPPPSLIPRVLGRVKRKETIPKALREQVWLQTAGRRFTTKCPTRWCGNAITAFDFHVGHNKPEAAGGTLHKDNLIAICARCNTSMGAWFTFDEWNRLVLCEGERQHTRGWWSRLFCRAGL